MNDKIITHNGREHAISFVSAQIEVTELIRRFRDTEKFIAYCKACNNYNACWSCPPFDFDTDTYLTSCKTACIIGAKIFLDKETTNQHQGLDKCTRISYEIIGAVRKELDNMLLEMEEKHPQSRAFFAGSCHICPTGTCTKIAGEPCISPEKVRPSLEALGFDVSRISAELLNIEMQWSRDGILPEYFTLVSGFFTVNKIQ